MDPISFALIGKALDGLALRQDFTAQNIANANSPSYRPVRVSFEEALRVAADRGVEDIQSVQPQISEADAAENTDIRLDLELAQSSQTAMRYRALIDLLGRQMSLERIVVSNGGR